MQLAATTSAPPRPGTVDVATIAKSPQNFDDSVRTVTGHFIGTEAGGRIGTSIATPRCPCPDAIDEATAITVTGPVKGVDALFAGFGADANGERFGDVALTGTVDVQDGVAVISNASVVPTQR